jgi:hypothetical protein
MPCRSKCGSARLARPSRAWSCRIERGPAGRDWPIRDGWRPHSGRPNRSWTYFFTTSPVLGAWMNWPPPTGPVSTCSWPPNRVRFVGGWGGSLSIPPADVPGQAEQSRRRPRFPKGGTTANGVPSAGVVLGVFAGRRATTDLTVCVREVCLPVRNGRRVIG